MQHFFAEKCTSPLPENNSRNPFPLFLLLHLHFDKPMPIIYFEGIKPPCNSTETQSLVLQGKGRWMTISNNGLRLSHRPLQLQTFKNYLTFAFVRGHRGSKEKVIGKIPTNINFLESRSVPIKNLLSSSLFVIE